MAADSHALDSLLDPLSRCLDAESARRLADFQVNDVVIARVEYLAARANDGLLTEEERAEYEALVNAADLVGILKVKAIRQLESIAR